MTFKVSAVQMSSSLDKEENLTKAEGFIKKAAAEGATIVALPEIFNWKGPQEGEWESAETIPGYTTNRLAGLAKELEIYLVCGSILEKAQQQGKVYNTCVLLEPSGQIVTKYRKIHLFDVALKEKGVVFRESGTRLAGERAEIAKINYCPIGLAICYDLRFPEIFRDLALKGAKILFLPSSFTDYTGRAHWEILVRARAIENQVYIVAPDKVGFSFEGILIHGNSLIVDPWGKILAKGGNEEEGIIIAEIDLDYLEKVREELPSLNHAKSRLHRLKNSDYTDSKVSNRCNHFTKSV